MSEIIKEGWCTKKGAIMKSWKKRWFSLSGKTLTYREQKTSQKLKGTISLENAHDVVSEEDAKHPFKFIIRSKERNWEIAAENQEERNSWISVIKRTISGEDPTPVVPAAAPAQIPPEAEKQTQSEPAPVESAQPQEQPPEAEIKKLSRSDFQDLKLLGEGAFGKVRLVRCTADPYKNRIFALKSLRTKELIENGSLEYTRKECDIITKINSNFVVKAHQTFSDESHIYIVMDYLPGGELFQRISTEGHFTEDRARIYCAQLALALDDFHANKIIHRDIKPENVLFGPDGYLKLSDMGYARQFQGQGDSATTFCGTPMYIAPEMLLGKEYSYAVDWWGLGIILFEMIAGYPPFYDENTQLLYRLILETAPKVPEDASPECAELILKLMEKDPEKRISSLETIKESPFFGRAFAWDDIKNKKLKMEWVPDTSNLGTDNFDPIYTEQDPTRTVARPADAVMVEGFTYLST